jgi:hypothetical protein
MAAESAADLLSLFDLDDFAVQVTLNGTTIHAIVDYDDVEVMGDFHRWPVLTVRTMDLDADPHGDSVVLNGTTYTIVNVDPDGTGVSRLVLNT